MKYELFLNDYYKVLKYLYENESDLSGKRIVRLSQIEIAKALNMSKGKVNSILQVLCNEHFIKLEGNGRYFIYKQSKDFISKISKL